MLEQPKAWINVKLGEICSKPQYGWTSRAIKSGTWRYLRTTDISGNTIDWERVPFCEKIPDEPAKYKVFKNDILVSRAGSVGISYRLDEVPYDVLFASYLIRFKPVSEIETKFVSYYLKSDRYWRSIFEFTAGIAIPNVNATKLADLDIPIAPLNEQRRIAAKLDELLAKVDACKARLDKIPAILKRFRQSVLAAACSGRLTADWREQNPDVEPAEELLDRIAQERSKNVKSHRTILKSNSTKAKFEIQNFENNLSSLPDSWKWVALGNYAVCERGRFSFRPRNDPRFYDGKYPFIQIGDLPKNGGIVSAYTQTLNEKGLKISKMFPKGTVVIAIVGATIGNTGRLGDTMCFPDSLIGIQTGFEDGNIYVEYFLQAEKEKMRNISYSSGGQPNIKLETINHYPFPLPPISEQKEIVRRVEALFKFADQIEKRYQTAKAHVDKLTQSILAKAFRGELVPQDPNDEPAAKLLERIRAEREKQERIANKRNVTPANAGVSLKRG